MGLGNSLSVIVGILLITFMLFIIVKFPVIILLIGGLIIGGILIENRNSGVKNRNKL